MANVRRLSGSGLLFTLSVLSVIFLSSCRNDPTAFNMPQVQQDPLVIPVGFPKPVIPADNPLTPAKVELGRQLFYKNTLSKDNSVSCASCHSQSNGFSDISTGQGLTKVSIGVNHAPGTRNAPSLVNLAYDTTFFWDGRAHTLEQQVLSPITNPIEMANDSTTVLSRLSSNNYYSALFQKAFGDSKITMNRIAQAIASFERTLISGNSPYDKYMAGDVNAISESAKRGLKLFNDTSATGCSGCHSGVNFTDNGFYSTGFQQEYYGGDQGRAAITGNQNDVGKFKTPSLRNVKLSAPYAANGGTATLLEMVVHYNQGGVGTKLQDRRIRKLNLTDDQMQDIVAFMESLTDSEFTSNKNFSKPASF